MKLFPLLCLLLVSGAGICQDNPSSESYLVSLELGEGIDFGNRAVKFEKLISDSRCPRNVSCIWAGEVELLLGLYENGKQYAERTITLSGGAGVSVLKQVLSEFAISLSALAVSPYPETARKPVASEYVLHLRVEKIFN